MITRTAYFMGRDVAYPMAMSPGIEREADRTVELVNALLHRAQQAGVSFDIHPITGTMVSSGWRPPSLNANTPGAAPNSKHMTGQAVDVYDPDGDLDEWLMSIDGQDCMTELGLWHEHPSATKGWAHLQTLPPRSGRRTFYP